MRPPAHLAFVDAVKIGGGGSPNLELSTGTVTLARCSPGVLAALRLLAEGGASEAQLVELVTERDGRPGAARILYHLDRLDRLGLLRHTVVHEGSPVTTVLPFSTHEHAASWPEQDAEARCRLSRFAYVRRVDDELVLDCPLAADRLILHDHRVLAVLAALAEERSVAEVSESVPGLPPEVVSVVLRQLLRCGALATVPRRATPDGQAGGGPRNQAGEEDRTGALRQWEFHDLVFHSLSRMGRHRNPYGATHRFRGLLDPLPAVKPPRSDDLVPLYKPDLQALVEADPSFSDVLERRRSIRSHGQAPISVDQLGEFLYRSARIRSLASAGPVPYEHSSRPYPGGGACYELEVYPVVRCCAGLDAGIYHYRPLDHALERISEAAPQADRLLEHANWAAAEEGVPQVLLVIAARYQRIGWAYSGMAYAAVLKHVGVLFQTMYLVATAMDLAACALGGGDADLFAQATGLDYVVEGSVGEFMLGRP